jgi:transposase
MRKLREALRLHHESKLPARAIAASLRVSSSTVVKYLGRAKVAKIVWPIPPHLDDAAIERLLFPEEQAPQRNRPEPEWPVIWRELKKKHVTKMLLWQEYREAVPNGLGYSQFCERYNEWRRGQGYIMRREHKAGERVFVDFSGDGIAIVDPVTGEVSTAKLFVAVLGASNFTYIEPVLTEATPVWVQCHVNAFAYFGGVTEITVPDNLKSGVIKPDLYEPELNRTYAAMAEHYGTAVIPARVRKPRDKAKVEQGVLLAERWVIAVLRHREFHSLAELKQAVRELNERLNDRPMKKFKVSRRQLFESVDKPSLKPLPQTLFELCDWKKVRLDIDYHVEYDAHYYSVHYSHYGKGHRELWIRATDTSIEVFFASSRIAAHQRSYDTHKKFITLPEHMPEPHRRYLEWPPSRLIAWGQSVGPNTGKLVEKLLEKFSHPEQGYKSCRALLRLAQSYPVLRMENACARALHYGTISYKSVQAILKNQLDQLPLGDETRPQLTLPWHENIRGPSYYH